MKSVNLLYVDSSGEPLTDRAATYHIPAVNDVVFLTKEEDVKDIAKGYYFVVRKRVWGEFDGGDAVDLWLDPIK